MGFHSAPPLTIKVSFTNALTGRDRNCGRGGLALETDCNQKIFAACRSRSELILNRECTSLSLFFVD